MASGVGYSDIQPTARYSGNRATRVVRFGMIGFWRSPNLNAGLKPDAKAVFDTRSQEFNKSNHIICFATRTGDNEVGIAIAHFGIADAATA